MSEAMARLLRQMPVAEKGSKYILDGNRKEIHEFTRNNSEQSLCFVPFGVS